jgi:hypothetical protein
VGQLLLPDSYTGPPPDFAGVNRDSPQADGLVYWWAALPCRGTTVLRDFVQAKNAPLSGNAALSLAGPRGWGMALDGSGDYADTPSLTIPVPFTIMVWVRNDAADGNIRGVFRLDGASTIALYRWSNGRWAFYTGGSLEGDFTQAGVWELVILTYDGVTKRLYINGAETVFGAGGASATLSASTGTLRIGGDGFGQHFNGQIGELRVYNYAQTLSQVKQFWNPATDWDLYDTPYRRFFFVPAGAGGPQTVSPDPVGLTLSPAAVTTAVSPVSVAPSPVNANLAPVAVSAVVGGVSVAPSPVGVNLAPAAVTYAVSGVSVAPSPVEATLAPVAPTASQGEVIATPDSSYLTLQPAPVTADGGVLRLLGNLPSYLRRRRRRR